MKYIKRDFRSKAWVRPPGWTDGVGQKVKIRLFQNMVMLRVKLNGITNAATW